MKCEIINGTNVIVSKTMTKELFETLCAHYGERIHWYDSVEGYNFVIPDEYDYSKLALGVEIAPFEGATPCGMFWLGYNGKYTLDA